jgi:hypothetical protein
MQKDPTIYSETEAKQIVDDFISKATDVKETRESQFLKYQDFVLDGNQWEKNEVPEGGKPCLTFNQSQDHYFTYLSKLFPRNSQTGTLAIGVKVKGEKKEAGEKEILSSYNKNKFASIVLEQGQNFFIGGDGCFYYPQDPVTKEAKIISLDPSTVYLGWDGQHLTQFAFEDEVSLGDVEQSKQHWLIQTIKNFIKDETEATRKFKKAKRITYWDNSCQVIAVEGSYKTTKNENGFIPFSWIPNMPKAHKHEGVPEAKKLYNLDKEYNQRASDFGQRAKANTKAVLAAFTNKNTKDLDGENLEGILPFAPEDRAEFLKLDENKELLDYLSLLDGKMGEKMAINDAVKGSVKSNISSLAMVYYFSPLMDRIGLKRIFWDEAFRELNKAILIYKFGAGDWETDPIYEPVLLTDQKTKIDNTVEMLTNHLISHEDAIDELRGSENASQKLELILADAKKFEAVAPPKTPIVPAPLN